MRVLLLMLGAFVASALQAKAHGVRPTAEDVDAEAAHVMQATGAQGLALAYIKNGTVVHARAYGKRNAKGAPLETDTIMYGASLTKAAFAYMVMQLVEEGVIDLD